MRNSRGGAWSKALGLALAVALLVPAAGQAAPVFLSPIDLSDAGGDAYDARVAQDANGNSLTVWNRDDGANFRIQARFRAEDGTFGPTATISSAGDDAFEPRVAFDSSGNAIAVWTQWQGAHSRIHAAFRPAAGSFGASQPISPSGQTAREPRVSIDSTGKALAVWSIFDGTIDRIQAAIRPANGSFGAVETLSPPGVESYEPNVAAGPNIDANGTAVWTGTDGTNLRVQSARRRDYVGYPRPISATPNLVPLVVAYDSCEPASANRVHGPGFPGPPVSCHPPSKASSVLTVGTFDANGLNAQSVGSVRWKVLTGDPATEANEADVVAVTKITDVRNHGSGTDYTGRLGVRVDTTITDQRNAPEQPEAGTTQAFPLEFGLQCVTTASTSIGAECAATTSLNAVLPGAVPERKRSVWAFGQTIVRDAGANGTGYAACPPTCGDGDEKTFMRQGFFVP